MDFHGYDTGDPNKWYQSRSDLRDSAMEYGNNYHGSHFHSYSHHHQFHNPHLWMSSPNPVPSNPSFYHHTSYSPPPLSNHTIINGHSLPLQFPFSSQISQPMNHQPAQPIYYPQSQLYNPFVCVPPPQFHAQPTEILPTKATTTPPIYHFNSFTHSLVPPTETNPKAQVPGNHFTSASLHLEAAKVVASVDKTIPREEDTTESNHDLGLVAEIGKGRHGGPHYQPEFASATPPIRDPCFQIPELEVNGAIDDNLACNSRKEDAQGVCENAAEDFEVVNLDPSYKVTSTVVDKILDDTFTTDYTKPLDILHRYALFDDLAIEDISKEEYLHVFIALVYASCKLCPLEVRKKFLWNMFKPKLVAMIISYIPLMIIKFGKANLPTCAKIEVLKQNVSLLIARMWVHWNSKLTVETSLDDIERNKELNVEFIIKTMDCLTNIMGCNIDLTNDNDALWLAQYQIVYISLPTAWLLPVQSSCHNMRRIIKSHFRCPNLSDIGIYEAVTRVTFGAVDYSSSCFILVSQNLFQVTILNSKSKAALLGLQFVMSSVPLESLILEFDKSGSMFMDHVIMALVDALLECNHWIVEWAKDKPGWEELLKYESEFNQHVLVTNVIAHVQLNVETLSDEMGHTRVLGLHVFFGEVHVIFLELDLAIKCVNHHRFSNNHFYLVLRYAITSIPKCRAFFKDCVTGKGTILEVRTILLSDLGLVEIQNHKFSSSESGITLYIMGISVIMKFEDYIATTIQELVDFFVKGDKHWNVLQKFMEFKFMILGKDTTSELIVWQDAIVKNHQLYLGKLNARYVALLTLREVISVEELGQTVRFRVSSEEIIDFPKIISESYCFWVFEVDTKVILATLRVAEVMYLLPLEYQTEHMKQVVAKIEVSDFQGLLQVHYLLKGYPHDGFDGNREREENAECLLHNVHLFVAFYSIRVTIVGMLYTIVADALCVFCSLTNDESNSIAISWKSKLTGYSLCPIATQASTAVLLWTRANFLCWTLSSGCCKYVLSLAGVCVDILQSILINHAEYNLIVWNNIMASYFFTEDCTNQVGIALPFAGNNIITKSMEITKLVCDGDDLLNYVLQWGILLLILYFGFISLLSVHGYSWYHNMRISFDNIMALKALSVILSGTLLKIIVMV